MLLTIWNGPAPTGFSLNSSPSFWTAAGEAMWLTLDVMSALMAAPYDRLKWRTTVWSSGVVTPSGPNFGQDVTGLHTQVVARSRVMFQATALALNGVPSWNWTPWRSDRVTVLPPSENWYPVASTPSTSPAAVSRNSWP